MVTYSERCMPRRSEERPRVFLTKLFMSTALWGMVYVLGWFRWNRSTRGLTTVAMVVNDSLVPLQINCIGVLLHFRTIFWTSKMPCPVRGLCMPVCVRAHVWWMLFHVPSFDGVHKDEGGGVGSKSIIHHHLPSFTACCWCDAGCWFCGRSCAIILRHSDSL